jgi:hypothetical protein
LAWYRLLSVLSVAAIATPSRACSLLFLALWCPLQHPFSRLFFAILCYGCGDGGLDFDGARNCCRQSNSDISLVKPVFLIIRQSILIHLRR